MGDSEKPQDIIYLPSTGWPRYEPMVFSTAVNVSSKDLDTLNRARLPERFLGGGITLEEPLGVDVPGLGYLIKFAQGYLQGFYYDPATGGVWWIYDRPGPEPRLVNSSLEQFTRTVQAIIDAFPFSDGVDKDIEESAWDDDERIAAEERDIAERNATAAKLRDRMREIDPAAVTPIAFGRISRLAWRSVTMRRQMSLVKTVLFQVAAFVSSALHHRVQDTNTLISGSDVAPHV